MTSPPTIDAAILWYYEEILEAVEHPLPRDRPPNIDAEELMDVLGSIAIVYYQDKTSGLILISDLMKYANADNINSALSYYLQWKDVQELRGRWPLPTRALIDCIFEITNLTLTNHYYGKNINKPTRQENESRGVARPLSRSERALQCQHR